MNKQEFIKKAKEQGVREENIQKGIEVYELVKKELPSITFEETLEGMIKAQNTIDNEPEGTVSVCAGPTLS